MTGPRVSNTPVVLILGPTAVGKSALALALAARRPIEIVSVDSGQVYRGMDIGTAKPLPVERRTVRHHLIDIRDPDEVYSAAEFVRDACDAIATVRSRGATPVLVGGTMLYFDALVHGLAELPPADADLRRRLVERGAREGWPTLHRELRRIDPDAAERIHPNDPQRLQRALEVHALTGQPLSRLQRRRRSPLVGQPVKFALWPASRAGLHEAIECRFDAMLAAGFTAEVRALLARWPKSRDAPSMRAVGYRQCIDYLEGGTDFVGFRARAIAASRQLAKRQSTWMRGMSGWHALPCARDAAIAQIERRLDTPSVVNGKRAT